MGIILPPSKGKLEPCRDEKGEVIQGSIAEKTKVSLNGTELGMIIKGEDMTKPVLLVMGGGPGIPEYFLDVVAPSGLEKEFVVCFWDYRGTGLSYDSDVKPEDMTTDQYLTDAVTVTNYLRERFQQDKIYILGHSFGTYLSIQLVAQYPEYYQAYIAMGQMTDDVEREKMDYDYLIQYYESKGNDKMLKKLEKYAYTEKDGIEWVNSWYGSGLRDMAQHDAGVGTMRDMKSVISGIVFPSLRITSYTPKERIQLWKGKIASNQFAVNKEINYFHAKREVPSIQISIYFFAGKYDYTCAYPLQKEYFEQLQAPKKKFYTFENSAHSPLFEEPEKAMQIIRKDIL